MLKATLRRAAPLLVSVLGAGLFFTPFCRAQNAVTRIDTGTTILQTGIKRFGMNLGELSFYDSGQMLKNMAFRNPGFEGMVYRSVMRCASGTATSCLDEVSYTGWSDGFWNGARFEIIWGTAKGRSGIVSNFRRNPTTYTFADSGVAPAAGDYILLSKEFAGGAIDGWWPSRGGTGTITTETVDLSPDTPGKQCVRLQALNPSSESGVNAFFDSTAGIAFVRLTGRYRVSFSARGVAGARQIWVHAKRNATQWLNNILTLSPEWSRYSLEFTAAESSAPQGTGQLTLAAANGSEILLDDVSFERIDSDPANTTVFRDEVVSALKEFQPGILRHWAGQLGDTLDNQIAPTFARMRSGYSSNSSERDELTFDLEEFLQLCAVLGAEPWYVVPITFSPEEAAGLIQYLAGSSTTPYGAKRAARGRLNPWTDTFPRIHLEFGNESWNSVFKGGAIEWPVPYGSRATEIFGAMRRAPEFKPVQFDLVLGGQAVYVDRNRQILSTARNYTSFTVAPYLMNDVNSFATNEDLFGPLFAEPQQVVRSGYMRENADLLRLLAPTARLSTYEVNLHTLGGSITQDRLDALAPSLGAGIAVAEHMMLMLRDLGVKDQLLFKLPQFKHNRPDGKEVRLWGSVVDMGVTNRRRPQFLAIQLMNEALGGQMLETTHSGSDPTWNQPYVNDVQLDGARHILSFALQNGVRRKLILFNLHRTATLPVSFSGVNAPSGSVVVKTLNGPDITASNENARYVTVGSSIYSMNADTVYSLPPYTITVLSWDAKL